MNFDNLESIESVPFCFISDSSIDGSTDHYPRGCVPSGCHSDGRRGREGGPRLLLIAQWSNQRPHVYACGWKDVGVCALLVCVTLDLSVGMYMCCAVQLC